MSKMPRPLGFSKFSSEVASGTLSGSKPGPSSAMVIRTDCSEAWQESRTCLELSKRLPWRMALVSASSKAICTPKPS